MTTLAVIIVNFNGMRWIKNCLESALEQEVQVAFDLGIIFVDNGSSDGSADYVRQEFPSISVCEMDENLGFGSGCNFGVDESSAEYIVFLNNDTVLPEETLACLLGDLLTRELHAIAAIEAPYESGTPTLRRTTIDPLGYPIHLFRWDRFSELPSFYFSAVCLLFRKSTSADSGGLDGSFFLYFEDIDWFWRLQLLGYRFDYAQNCTVRHAGHGSTGGHQLSYHRFLLRNINLPKMLIKNLRFANLLWVMPLDVAGYIIPMCSLPSESNEHSHVLVDVNQ